MRRNSDRGWASRDDKYFAIYTGIRVGHLGGIDLLFQRGGCAGSISHAFESGPGRSGSSVYLGAPAYVGRGCGSALFVCVGSARAVVQGARSAGCDGRGSDAVAYARVAAPCDTEAGRATNADGFGGGDAGE